MVFTTLHHNDTSQLKKIDDYKNIHSVYSLYLMIAKVIWHITEKNGSKYWVFDSVELHSTNENKEILKKYK